MGNRRIVGWTLIVTLVASGLAATAQTATAAANDTVTFGNQYPGKGIIFDGGDHANDVTVDIGDTSIVFHDPTAVGLTTNSPCVLTDATTVTCPKASGAGDLNKVFSVSVRGNGGDDHLTSTGFGMVIGSTFRPIAVTLSGFAGNDIVTALGGYSSLIGGIGDDVLTSGPGTSTDPQFRDMVQGSEGNDTIDIVSNSPDVDGVYCDTQWAQSYTDWLTRGANDLEYAYFAYPNSIPGGCDNVTIV